MSKRMSRRILVVALIVFFIAMAILDQRNWWWAAGSHIPVVTTLHLYVGLLFAVPILLHVFWLNRKPFFSFFSRTPNLSGRGIRQMVVLLLTLLFLGITVTESLQVPLEPWWRWWFFAWIAAALGHMWLNRRALFSHIGRRFTVASFALLSATAILLPTIAAFAGMFA